MQFRRTHLPNTIFGLVLIYLLIVVSMSQRSALSLNLGYVALTQSLVAPEQQTMEKASNLLHNCLEKAPPCSDAAYGLAIIAAYKEDYSQAIDYLAYSELYDQHNPLILFRLANNWGQMGNIERTLAYWRAADVQAYWTAQGDWQRREGKEQEAIQSYQKALLIEMDWVPAREGLAIVYHDQINSLWKEDRFEDAKGILLQVIELDPQPWDFIRLGDYARNQDDPSGAMSWYEKGAILFPNYSQYDFRIGRLALGQADYVLAESSFLHAIELNPDNAQAHFLLGTTYLAQERWMDAEQALQVKNKLAADEWSYARLGDVYIAQNRFDEAGDAYHRALSISPDFAYAQRKLQSLKP